MHPHGSKTHLGTEHSNQTHLPRLIAWEVTRSCPLACKHCRAAAHAEVYSGELSTDQCYKLIDNIVSFSNPILILTGGEPMLRPDIYDIARYATDAGLRVVMAPCGTLIDDESARKILASGVKHISISLDGATAESHDEFRGVPGAFENSLRGLQAAKRAGIDFQINTTITTDNLHELEQIMDLAVELGASVFNPFMLVPTGRGKALVDHEISAQQYEQTLEWLAGQQSRDDITVRVTCAPHYQRITRQLGCHTPGPHSAKGCMGGQSFAFISHRGKVQICGFLDTEAGDLRKENLDFRKVWEESELFAEMRNPSGYHGRCGYCEFNKVCGGCRARAFALTGDYLADEPFCLYEPKKKPSPELDAFDAELLSNIQTDFPVVARPFDVLSERFDADAEKILQRVSAMVSDGLIRRLGAVFDSKSLGYVSTLVAAAIPPDRLTDVAEMVSELPGVTHNYRREHRYNLWFTLTSESQTCQAETLAGLKSRTGIDEFHSLPALSVYKIGVNFKVGSGANRTQAPKPASPSAGPVGEFSDQQKKLVRILQESLTVTDCPFDEVAMQLGWSVEQVIDQIQQWRQSGVMRRFGTVMNHRRLGFAANGMAVFRMENDRLDEAAERLVGCDDISHCYHRPAIEGFDYNLYAMVHGKSVAEVRSLVGELAEQISPLAHDVLFSTREFKKVSMRYFLQG